MTAPNPAHEGLHGFQQKLRWECNYSPHTVAAYVRDVEKFLAWLQGQTLELAHTQSDDVRRYASQLFRQEHAPRSIQRSLAALRNFFGHLIDIGQRTDNPAHAVKAPRQARTLPKVLDVDTMMRLLDTTPEGNLGRRDLAMFELLYSSGLRVSELVGLDCDRLDLSAETVRVLGKGRKERQLPVGRRAVDAVRGWLEVRGQLAQSDEPALFVSRRGRRMTTRNVQLRLRRFGYEHGSAQALHPHMLRHSFASHVLESSGNLRAVQELLGHRRLGTTQIYTHLDYQHLAKTYDAAHPRARRRN